MGSLNLPSKSKIHILILGIESKEAFDLVFLCIKLNNVFVHVAHFILDSLNLEVL